MSRSGQYKCLAEGNWTFVICAMVASRNQGNEVKATNSSSSPRRSQNPWGETLATSTPEVRFPAVATFIYAGLNKNLSVPNLPIAQAVILRQCDHWLKPELGLPVPTGHVDVHTGLFTREEVKSEGTIAEYGGAHGLILDLTAKLQVA
jgi:hypothetical protein